MYTRVAFCFHTFDHEINCGIGCLSSFLEQHHIDTNLVVCRKTADHSDTPEGVVSRILQKRPSIVVFSVMTCNWRWDFGTPSLDSPELSAQYICETANKFRDRFANQNVQAIFAKLRAFVRPP